MTFALAPHVSVTETDNGMVLLDERAGRYWQLNATGATVVRLLLDGGTVQQAIGVLCALHPLPRERVAADVDALMHSLHVAQVVASS
jgi:hypothetical protein